MEIGRGAAPLFLIAAGLCFRTLGEKLSPAGSLDLIWTEVFVTTFGDRGGRTVKLAAILDT